MYVQIHNVLYQGRVEITDGINFVLLIMKWERALPCRMGCGREHYSWEVSSLLLFCFLKWNKEAEKEAKAEEMQWWKPCNVRKMWYPIADFEDGRQPRGKKVGHIWELEKTQENILHKGEQAPITLSLA